MDIFSSSSVGHPSLSFTLSMPKTCLVPTLIVALLSIGRCHVLHTPGSSFHVIVWISFMLLIYG